MTIAPRIISQQNNICTPGYSSSSPATPNTWYAVKNDSIVDVVGLTKVANLRHACPDSDTSIIIQKNNVRNTGRNSNIRHTAINVQWVHNASADIAYWVANLNIGRIDLRHTVNTVNDELNIINKQNDICAWGYSSSIPATQNTMNAKKTFISDVMRLTCDVADLYTMPIILRHSIPDTINAIQQHNMRHTRALGLLL